MREDKKLPYEPVKCVVCTGFGSVNWGKQVCHACDGKGYILIPTERDEREEAKRYER